MDRPGDLPQWAARKLRVNNGNSPFKEFTKEDWDEYAGCERFEPEAGYSVEPLIARNDKMAIVIDTFGIVVCTSQYVNPEDDYFNCVFSSTAMQLRTLASNRDVYELAGILLWNQLKDLPLNEIIPTAQCLMGRQQSKLY